MKKFLLAATAVALCATAATALDDDRHQTRIHAASGSHIMMSGDGPVIEVRGEDGERTVHIERDGSESTLRVNGQEIEVRGDVVIVDGQEIEVEAGSVVIIEGDEVRVVDSEFGGDYGTGFAMHWAERAEGMARMHVEMARLHETIDIEGVHEEAMRSMELALAGLDEGEWEGRVIIDHDGERRWEDLSDEEREEIREELEEAREEIRESMREMRVEMRRANEEMTEAEREMRDAERESRRALRDAHRAERDAHRAQRDAHRAARHAERDARREAHREERREARHAARVMRWHSDGNHDGAVDVRVFEDEDGNQRVIISGEEVVLNGDDVMRWRSDGEHGGAVDVRVFEDEDGNQRVIISGEEVDLHGDDVHVIDRLHGAQMGNLHVERSESIRVEEDSDGRRRIWVDGEEQTGDDLVDWLNRLEAERLSGGEHSRKSGRRVVRLELNDGEDTTIDLEGRRVMVLREHRVEEEDED